MADLNTPLPKSWSRRIQGAVLDIISLAHWSINGFKLRIPNSEFRIRYGAVQKHGSISVVERFIRTLKTECTRRIIVPLDINSMRDEVSSFVMWYNCFRPHQGLNGRFPIERYFGKPKRKRPYKVKGPDAEEVELFVSYFGDKKHLPLINLRKSA